MPFSYLRLPIPFPHFESIVDSPLKKNVTLKQINEVNTSRVVTTEFALNVGTGSQLKRKRL